MHKTIKAENIDDLKQEVVRLKKELKKSKKYGLVWEDRKEDVAEQSKQELPVLEEVGDYEINNGNEGQPINILIEGDNYHALSVLNYTHQGKIDVIYIDPPYNTGNKTWKYNNRYVEEDDAFKHSKWISFIYKRLKLAKKLLSSDGVICVTIDNYEVHNLRHIIQEIFRNREIVITVIEHNFRGRAKNNFALTHEYAIWAIPKDKEIITRLKEKSEDIKRNLRRTGQGSRRKDSPTLFYGIEIDTNKLSIISTTEPIAFGESLPKSKKRDRAYVLPIDTNGIERRWYYGSKTLLKEYKDGNIEVKIIKGRFEIHYEQPGDYKRRKSVWSGKKYDGSTYGSELLTEIIGENDFPFPKSIHAVMDCLDAATNKKNAIILDFFAGSGTVGHAVLQLNKINKTNKQFIICTNNENNICTEICYPRVKNVMVGYKFHGKEKTLLYEKTLTVSFLKNPLELKNEMEKIYVKHENEFDNIKYEIENNILSIYGIKEISDIKEGLGGNLRYYRTAFVSAKQTDKNKKVLTEKATDMLCLKENTFLEVKTKNKAFRVFKNKNKYTGIIYDCLEIEEFKKFIKDIIGSFNVYIFSLGDDTFEDEFENFNKKVKLSPIPEAIMRVYRRIFN